MRTKFGIYVFIEYALSAFMLESCDSKDSRYFFLVIVHWEPLLKYCLDVVQTQNDYYEMLT